jgi:hypothetical protein
LSSLTTARKLTAAAHHQIIALCFIARSAITFGAQCTAAGWRAEFPTQFISPAALPNASSNPAMTPHFDGVERLRNLSFIPDFGKSGP